DAPGRTGTGAELATLADLAHLSGPDGLPARHVVTDALTAAALARAHGVPPEAVAAGWRAYRPGGHRIAHLATVDQVAYVDDSKATNAHAAAASLGAFPAGTVVWIAGGLAKGATFDDLVRDRADRLRAAGLVGVDREPWRAALTRHAPGLPAADGDPTDTGTVRQLALSHAR